ncbi:MAG: PQQ-binding-like beta-propeller repeat protein [Acidobacteriaceae bacterium]|nr:PQQ-binding-like beta-propeller repeat protein [Acidobacteriaceae bacterium]
MTRALLITGREYRQMITLPAFWIVSLILPVFVLLAPIAQTFLSKSKTASYVLVDRSGRYGGQIRRRVELDYQRQVLVQLLVYANQWRAINGTTPSGHASAEKLASSSDAAVESFMAAGGASALLRQLQPRLLPGAPPFQPPARALAEIPVPNGVDTDTADRFGASIAHDFLEPIKTATGSAALAAAVFIPANVDAGGQVRVWTNGPAAAPLVQDLKIELTQSARLRALKAAGLDPLSAAQIESVSVPVSVSPSETPASGHQASARSLLPLMLAYLLLVSMIITGSMMLQGLVEERSNKLLEAVLACVTPRELMVGKLLGISAIGLSIVALWVAAAVAIVKAQPSSPLSFLIPALVSLSRTPGTGAAIVFYFVAGFLVIGMIFLGVGLVRDNMQEAQAYLTPLTLVIALPSVMLSSIIYRDPNGFVPRAFSWIPIYTPVTMLARLHTGVSHGELFGTATVLLAFGSLEVFALTRLFENNLLQTRRGFAITRNVRPLLRVALAIVLVAGALAVRHSRVRKKTADAKLNGPAHPVASNPAADPQACSNSAAFNIREGDWTGWSIDPRNWRFQPQPGLTALEISRLKVKWAFSYPGGNYGQPAIAGGRLFLAGRGGAIYSLDAKTGCLYWRFAHSTPSRTTVSVGPLPPVAASGYAAYFGDTSANVYAVDAATGALLWKTQVDSHPRAVLTGSPLLYKSRLYVSVSSYEEGVSSLAGYSCCTFRGSVVALETATGRICWKAFAIEHPPSPNRQNSAGTQMYGPAGAAVWSAPTLDAKRGRLYFATGNSYTDVTENGSDAVVAVNLESGRVIWKRQVTESDNDLSGCASRRKLINCPTIEGHDYDFGASPILVPLPNGKDIVVAGQKSGAVFGIDPDSGAVLWRTQVGVGGFLGGVLWGMATDGQRIYVANADVAVSETGRSGLFALNPATGKDIWYTPSPKVTCAWASGAPCFNAQSAAPFAVPGVIFAGTTDGHERAYAASDGHILWDFDTAQRTYRTINGIAEQPGGPIDVTSGSLAGGMLYVISGYRGILGGRSDNVLLAFSVDGR